MFPCLHSVFFVLILHKHNQYFSVFENSWKKPIILQRNWIKLLTNIKNLDENENIKIDEYIYFLCITSTATCMVFIPLSTCSKCHFLHRPHVNLLFILRRLQFTAWKMNAGFTRLVLCFHLLCSVEILYGGKAVLCLFVHRYFCIISLKLLNDLKCFHNFSWSQEWKIGFPLFFMFSPHISNELLFHPAFYLLKSHVDMEIFIILFIR